MRTLIVSTELTPTEQKVVDYLCEYGCTDKVIAENFGMALETVKTHMGHIFDKTGYGSRLEVAVNTLHKRYQGVAK